MKKLNFAVLLAALVSMGGKSYAHDIEVANADGKTIYYNFTNDKTELEVTYQGSSVYNADYAGNVVIPESVTYEGKTYPVTSIHLSAFYGCSGLTEVTIGSNVTSIGQSAFYGCSGLTELTIPSSVTSIGKAAFQYCRGLTEVTIPNSVTSIGESVFLYCSGLTEVTIGNGVTSIGTSAFSNCSGLTKVTIGSNVTSIGQSAFYGCSGLTEMTIPSSVTTIGREAFLSCSGLTEVTIPGSVTSIGDNAFSNCIGLKELTIPGSVTSIGSNAFSNCSSGLEKITVESGNPKYDSRENCNAIIETAKNEVFLGCKNTIIPGSVTSIGHAAFSNCTGLTELTIPGSVKSIGGRAFHSCGNLTELTIPGSVTSIGDYAFQYCSSLTEMTIPSSVTSIGRFAFSFCSKLTTLYSLNTTPPSARPAFDEEHYTIVDLFVPQEALEAYQNADVWKEFKKLQGFEYSSVKGVDAEAEQIHSANGQITVTGLTDGTTVAVYDLSGQQVGTATSKGGQVTISTGITAGAAAIVKVGERSVKVTMK